MSEYSERVYERRAIEQGFRELSSAIILSAVGIILVITVLTIVVLDSVGLS